MNKEYNIRIEGVAPLIMTGLSSDNKVESMLNNVDKDKNEISLAFFNCDTIANFIEMD